MCQVLGVSRSNYYDWLKRGPSARERDNLRLIEKVKVIFLSSRCTYGSRRIRHQLRSEGEVISRRRVRCLMSRADLHCKTKRKFKATTDSRHNLAIMPNLLNRDFTAAAPDQKYVGDITYVWTQEGWMYLAVVIDLHSRRVVGWSMKDNMRAPLVNDALLMAIWARKPKPGLIWHTDRGSQYASDSHCAILAEHKITQSMSRKGSCWDNAVSESFFHTLKT